MTGKNDVVFEAAERVAYQMIREGFDAKLESEAVDMYALAKELTQKFFKVLTSNDFMNRSTMPAEFKGVSWKDLSGEWQNYKKSKLRGSGDKFYYGISPQVSRGRHLTQQMRGQSAGALFGLPRVKRRQGTKTDNVFKDDGGPLVDTSSGRPRFASGTYRLREDGSRDSTGGRFVTLRATISVEMFPKLKDKTVGDAFERLDDKGRFSKKDGISWVKKLAVNEFGSAKVPSRPLLGPFLNWYIYTYAPAAFTQKFG